MPVGPEARAPAWSLRRRLGRALTGAVAAVLVVIVVPRPAPAATNPGPSNPATVLTAGRGQMAEAVVAVDPADPSHLAAAADPYGGGVHIEVTETHDGGRTWSPPVKLVPAGSTKSYDPTPLFLQDGRLVVVGGASSAGHVYCQPASRIFVASVTGANATFDIAQPPRPAVYVDRPTATADSESGAVVLSWTESRGPGAECRGVPERSSVVVRQWGHEARCVDPQPLSSTGSPAAFGAGLAQAGAAVVAAVRELGPGSRSRLTVSSSSDGGCTFGPVELLDEGPQPSATPAASGGFAVGVPSVALSPDGSTTVAWSVGSGPGVATRVLVRSGTQPEDGFRPLDPPPDAAGTELLPTLAADRQGGIWMATASATRAGLDFLLRRWAGTWAPAQTVASGAAGGYVELGEGLGLATAGPVLAALVPVDGPASSSLVLSTMSVPEPAPRRRPQRPARPGSTQTALPAVTSQTRPVGKGIRARPAVVAGLAGALVVALATLFVVGRRRHERPRLEPPAPAGRRPTGP